MPLYFINKKWGVFFLLIPDKITKVEDIKYISFIVKPIYKHYYYLIEFSNINFNIVM